jgi:hypothetical protein
MKAKYIEPNPESCVQPGELCAAVAGTRLLLNKPGDEDQTPNSQWHTAC